MEPRVVQALIREGWEIMPKLIREAFLEDKRVTKDKFEISLLVEGHRVTYRATETGVEGRVDTSLSATVPGITRKFATPPRINPTET